MSALEKPPTLFELIPAVYRVRDAGLGDPLRALVAILETEVQPSRTNIDELYDDWFIETCDEWVVPYIGDLLGVRGLVPVRAGVSASAPGREHDRVPAAQGHGGGARAARARRHRLAGAKAVEFFQRLAATQHVNHPRPQSLATVDLRDVEGLALLNGPFEHATHTVEVRHIDNGRGRYDIPYVGIFLWRLQCYPLAGVTAAAVAAATPVERGRFQFNPLGCDGQLFNVPRTEDELQVGVGEINVPGALRRRPLHAELDAYRASLAAGGKPKPVWFDENEPVLRVVADGAIVPTEAVAVCDLSDATTPPPEGWRRPSAPIEVSVDPVLGRLAFRAGVVPNDVEVDYSYAFPGDLGGGPYDRRASMVDDLPDLVEHPVTWQRARRRRAARGRLYGGDAGADAADRARRRHRHAFGDQVPQRPLRRDRRRAGRRARRRILASSASSRAAARRHPRPARGVAAAARHAHAVPARRARLPLGAALAERSRRIRGARGALSRPADHPGHAVAARQMTGGFGGMLSIRVKGGERAAIATAARVELWKRATSLGGVESLIEHRACIEGRAPLPAPTCCGSRSASRTPTTCRRPRARRSAERSVSFRRRTGAGR